MRIYRVSLEFIHVFDPHIANSASCSAIAPSAPTQYNAAYVRSVHDSRPAPHHLNKVDNESDDEVLQMLFMENASHSESPVSGKNKAKRRLSSSERSERPPKKHRFHLREDTSPRIHVAVADADARDPASLASRELTSASAPSNHTSTVSGSPERSLHENSFGTTPPAQKVTLTRPVETFDFELELRRFRQRSRSHLKPRHSAPLRLHLLPSRPRSAVRSSYPMSSKETKRPPPLVLPHALN